MECNINKAGYTATVVACRWVGAVMKHANSSIWAGAVMQKTPKNAENAKKVNGDRLTDRQTDRPTDRQTDRPTDRQTD